MIQIYPVVLYNDVLLRHQLYVDEEYLEKIDEYYTKSIYFRGINSYLLKKKITDYLAIFWVTSYAMNDGITEFSLC